MVTVIIPLLIQDLQIPGSIAKMSQFVKMRDAKYNRLEFRRQYIISPVEIECPMLSNIYHLNETYLLYSHIDLKVTLYEKDKLKIILLGDLFDYENPAFNNGDILEELYETDFEKIIPKTFKYTGRFVLICISADQIFLMHDATATRKIFYCKNNNKVYCTSLPLLLAKIAGINKTQNRDKQNFYKSDSFRFLNNSNIGNTTCYDEIFQLMPNHYLHLNESRTKRYWPNARFERMSLQDASIAGAEMIKGYMNSISRRYEIMLPVTAGKDSRTLLCATRDIQNGVYYYINKEDTMKETCSDIRIPLKLLKKLHLEFHVLDPYITIEPEFEKIYFANNESASVKYLPMIHYYYRYFSEKVNLPGNFAISGYDMYGKDDSRLTAKILAKFNYSERFDFALKYYSNWLEEAKVLREKYNVNLMILFYWEERLANWGTQIQLEKDIAQEDFNLYNSNKLITTFMSVDPTYVDRPNFELFKEIMRILWPESLNDVFNPSIKNSINKLLHRLMILELVRKIRFRIIHKI